MAREENVDGIYDDHRVTWHCQLLVAKSALDQHLKVPLYPLPSEAFDTIGCIVATLGKAALTLKPDGNTAR